MSHKIFILRTDSSLQLVVYLKTIFFTLHFETPAHFEGFYSGIEFPINFPKSVNIVLIFRKC